MPTGCTPRGARSPPPCTPPVWRECLRGEKGTIVGVAGVEHVEIGVVDGSGKSLEAHFVAVGRGESFGVESGLGGVEERVD